MTYQQQLEQQIEQLQTQMTFQEDLISSLNDMVTQQNKELSEVQQQLRWLGRKLHQLQQAEGPNGDPSQEPPPPHY